MAVVIGDGFSPYRFSFKDWLPFPPPIGKWQLPWPRNQGAYIKWIERRQNGDGS